MPTPSNTSSVLQTDNAAGASVTYNAAAIGFTPQSGKDYVLHVVWFANAGGTLNSVTLGGTTLTLDQKADGPAGSTNNHASIYSKINITLSAGSDLVLNFSAAGAYLTAKLLEYTGNTFTGVDAGTPNSASNTTGTAPSVATAATTSQANASIHSAFVECVATTNNHQSAPAGATTVINEIDSSTHEGGMSAYKDETTTGTKTHTYGHDNAAWAVAIVAYKVAALAPTINTQPEWGAAAAGGSVTFTYARTTSGGAVVDQAQTSVDGENWVNVSGAGATSYTTPALVHSDNGRWYRFRFTDDNGTTTSVPVRAWVTNLPCAGKGRLV